jgi:hypothetical protein
MTRPTASYARYVWRWRPLQLALGASRAAANTTAVQNDAKRHYGDRAAALQDFALRDDRLPERL